MAKRLIKAGLLGEYISRSRFSEAQELLCRRAGIDWEFKLFDSTNIIDFEFDDYIKLLREEGYDGVTITKPFKARAERHADIHIGYPSEMGASNLLKFGEQIEAYNTDYLGFIGAWKDVFGDLKPGKVAMAGAGGVARAIIIALKELGAERIDIWDNKPGVAAKLQMQIDPDNTILHVVTGRPETIVRAADGLVNASPLGMKEHPGSAFPADWINMQTWCFDAVYTPMNTPFMQVAKGAGFRCLSGFDLFKHMAIQSFAAYSGLKVSPSDANLLNHLVDEL